MAACLAGAKAEAVARAAANTAADFMVQLFGVDSKMTVTLCCVVVV